MGGNSPSQLIFIAIPNVSCDRETVSNAEILTRWEGPVAAMVSSHVDVEAAGPGDLLELSGRARGPPQIIQTSDHFKHRRQGNPASFSSEASMRTHAIVDVVLHRPVDAHVIGVGEELGLPIGINEADEDLVTRLDPDRSTAIVDGGRNLTLPIGAESAVESDPFHRVVQQFVIGFGRVHLRQPIDFRKIDLTLVRQVEVKQLGKLRSSAMHGASNRDDILPLELDWPPWLPRWEQSETKSLR